MQCVQEYAVPLCYSETAATLPGKPLPRLGGAWWNHAITISRAPRQRFGGPQRSRAALSLLTSQADEDNKLYIFCHYRMGMARFFLSL
jgi:hypothetical protein